jgi:RND superfamily putative drug exporter
VQFGGNAFGQPRLKDASSPYEVRGLHRDRHRPGAGLWLVLRDAPPLGVALFASGIALAGGILLSHVLAIANFAPILGSLIGLGVGIDYALFIVTRSRQELKRGANVERRLDRAEHLWSRGALRRFDRLHRPARHVDSRTFVPQRRRHHRLVDGARHDAGVDHAPSLAFAFQKGHVLSRRERTHVGRDGPGPVVVSGPWQRWAHFVSRHPRALTFAAPRRHHRLIIVPFFSLQLGSSDQGTDPASSTTRQAYDLSPRGLVPVSTVR